jgi:hypothetical protein
MLIASESRSPHNPKQRQKLRELEYTYQVPQPVSGRALFKPKMREATEYVKKRFAGLYSPWP